MNGNTAGPSTSLPSTPTSKSALKGRASTGQQKQEAQANPFIPVVPAEPLSPIISRLRKMWKFAAICQFLFTFDEAFGMSGFETEVIILLPRKEK
jgi:hypothetical protein